MVRGEEENVRGKGDRREKARRINKRKKRKGLTERQ